MHRFIALFAVLALPAIGNPLGEVSADIVVLGEVHDNPAHHAVQAEAVAALAPRAVVFEMLTEAQAARVSDDALDDPDALAESLDWSASGWPDFEMYYPIFTAGRGAAVYGAAVPREEARTAMQIGIARAFGAQAEAYGLTSELDAEELADRLNLQMAAHCNALPLDLLPGMVDLQRLRDAVLARAALDALAETGGPVAVITGNGHARKDWGLPAYVARIAPEVSLFSLGQSEDGAAPEGGFDLVLDAPGVDRPDPCLAFR
ncbi:ChaN family lipoprotein [Maritimibacter sp. HL-12]|uniref:ChaN family lipoprotein n=1 Tax=Maritimibacter sp. HL-12 TaxID=1162418 RepID=UPI000A0F3796|nr:ChaN family lipoprotein [Maritimibacter sp. HL-12]SMH51486.1 Uncharacterized iron-regulated protein [Maritimibacter sp. HL-12]